MVRQVSLKTARLAFLERLIYTLINPTVIFSPEPIRSRPGSMTHIAPQRFAGMEPWSQAHR
jgi:hypothetical protein